jgi:hypothetical protein
MAMNVVTIFLVRIHNILNLSVIKRYKGFATLSKNMYETYITFKAVLLNIPIIFAPATLIGVTI